MVPDSDQTPDDQLICQNENRPVPADDPRCLHPSTQCRFRELCEVIDAVRRKRREKTPPRA